MAKTFGQWLRGWRGPGIDQKAAAGLLGVSAAYLSDMERDRRGPPPDAILLQIAGLYGLSVDVVFFRAGRLPPDLDCGALSSATIKKAFAVLRERGDRCVE